MKYILRSFEVIIRGIVAVLIFIGTLGLALIFFDFNEFMKVE